MNKKSFLKISFTFIFFFINKMIFATTIEKEIFFSAYLKGSKPPAPKPAPGKTEKK